MKTLLFTSASALALALTAFSSVSIAEEFPGNSADPGNRIVCEVPADFGGGFHQSPGLCAQAVGELSGGFKGGPGQAWKFMRDMGYPVSNAKDCISANCRYHAQEYPDL